MARSNPNNYKGHKSEFRADTGFVTGHKSKHPGLNQAGQNHTSYTSRSFSEEKGSNTRPDSIHVATQNKIRNTEMSGPNHTSKNNPYLAKCDDGKYHENSGTSGAGHCLVERGGSIIKPGKVRGY